MRGLNKALFLDLNAVYSTKSKSVFPETIDDWKIRTGVLPKIKKYSDEGYIIIAIGNAGGIELGYTTNDFMIDLLNRVTEEVETYIRANCHYAYCPELEGYDRIPNPGLVYQYATALKLNLKDSIIVGDTNLSKLLAENVCMTFIWLTDFTGIYK